MMRLDLVCVCTSAECGSILSVVLDLSILPHQQTFQLHRLPLQQVAHGQQGAHQLSACLEKSFSFTFFFFFTF